VAWREPVESAYAPVCNSTTGAPVWAAASIWGASGSMNKDTRMPCPMRTAVASLIALHLAHDVEATFGRDLLATFRERSSSRTGRTTRAMSSISSVTAILEIHVSFDEVRAQRRTSCTWMWRRSSRKCRVMLSAPAIFGGQRGMHGVGIAAAARLAQRGYVVDVDAEGD